MNPDEVLDALKETFDPEALSTLAEIVKRIGVLDAVVATKSTDPDVLAEWLYHDKLQVLPVEEMKNIAIEQMEHLVDEGMIVDGVPTEEALMVSFLHTKMLYGDQTFQ